MGEKLLPIEKLTNGKYHNTKNDTGKKQTIGEKRLAATLGPMDAAIASKFVKTLQVAEGQQKRPVHMIENDVKEGKPTANKFQMGMELILYGGQGKKPNTSVIGHGILAGRYLANCRGLLN